VAPQNNRNPGFAYLQIGEMTHIACPGQGLPGICRKCPQRGGLSNTVEDYFTFSQCAKYASPTRLPRL